MILNKLFKNPMGINVRTKGHNAERVYRTIFRELGYDCTSSRESNRLLDALGVDLDKVPFNIQIKAGYKKGLNYSEVLDYTLNNLKERAEERLSLPTLMIHHKDRKKGKRIRTATDSLVIMTFDDFKKLISKHD